MIDKYLNNRFFILYLTPIILGLSSVFSFQPFNLTIINFIILPIFFYITAYINKKSKGTFRKKPYKTNLFIFGILFGFSFYISGISWITNSLTFDENFKILIPFALILIPLFLSLFMGFVILIIGPFLKFNFSSIAIFSFGIALSDFFRAKLFGGFPWNLWAYSFSWSPEIIQIVNFIGVFSFNLIVITIFTLPAVTFYKTNFSKKIIALVVPLLIIFTFYIYGNYEINKNIHHLKQENKKFHMKIVSPSFNLDYGLDINQIENKLKKLIRYSEPNKNKKTIFIWPEGVFSGYTFKEILPFKDLFKKNFGKNNFIIFGTNRLSEDSNRYFNSLVIVNNDFQILGEYQKQKLVPFGEFLPFENILSTFGLKKITEGYGSFVKGKYKNNILLEDLNILPLICYEVIFPSLIQNAEVGTNLVINISEDAWFGKTIGPDQHFAKSIFRAVESGSFFLRSANKGISAIINNKGVIIKQLNQNEVGNIEYEVPLIKIKNNKNDLIFFTLLITYLIIFTLNKVKTYE